MLVLVKPVPPAPSSRVTRVRPLYTCTETVVLFLFLRFIHSGTEWSQPFHVPRAVLGIKDTVEAGERESSTSEAV